MNPNGSAPRIQISLSKDQRKSMAASASVTPAKANGNGVKKTIHSTMAANPVLYASVRNALKLRTLNFKINVECKLRQIYFLAISLLVQ